MVVDLPEQVFEFTKFCSLIVDSKKSNSIDLSGCGWFYPTQLLPLIVFIKQNPHIEIISPENIGVSNYLATIKDKGEIKQKSYLPLVELPREETLVDETLKKLYNLTNLNKEYGGESAFKYTIGELVDNVYQHSEFKNAFVMAQSYSSKGFIEICFCDDGITIPGSLKKAGMIFEEEEHDKAIVEAINGLSAKNNKERGYGLWSNLNLVMNGLGGEFLIISGNGGVLVNKEGHKLFKLQEPNTYSGTLISIRVSNERKEVNLYEYLEPHKN